MPGFIKGVESLHNALAILSVIFLLSGCAKIAHLEQLLTIKAVSDNRDQQALFVEAQNQNFEKLLATVKSNQADPLVTIKVFTRDYGQPVFRRPAACGEQTCEEWLYRRATEYFNGEKVYVFFDLSGHLHHWDYFVPTPSTAQR